MNGTVKIDVFGVARDPQTKLNSLALKKYFSLVNYLEGSDVINNVDLHFIDTTETDMNNYPAVKNAIQQGRPLPITAVDGVVEYYGDIPYETIYQHVKRHLVLADKPRHYQLYRF
ncbi:hypothetical protein OXPF_25890 [Oxobacter pfennigii]|uniref:Arsenical resistance operon trans-acting repressor ArsD n=1 Tax=Oxobacter pfennigii TaxID=36849 RepID=A0A0P8WZE1_9CLOT|nr:hypothetical protein [Oxobacter pfennigii]KPU43844.1 hypothetical protein OXPF_25890 [Oxobacter pfennigii]